MRYDQMGLRVMVSSNLSGAFLPQSQYVVMGQDRAFGATGTFIETAAGIFIFLGVATGAIALVWVLKGGLWALGTAVALTGGYYLWRAASAPALAGVNPGSIASPYGPVQQVFRQIPGGIVGFMGEGFYQIIKPEGLGVFSGPTMNRPAVQTLAPGSMVRVFAQSENGYVQIDRPTPGFVCLNCSENPGGPWLVRKS